MPISLFREATTAPGAVQKKEHLRVLFFLDAAYPVTSL
jgi:hypothetical protein